MNLSPTKISTFEDCSMKFKYRYINHYRSKLDSANLEFGEAIHAAMERFFMNGEIPTDVFKEIWSQFEDAELDYSRYDSWEKLMESGTKLMDVFLQDEAEKFVETYTVEDWLKFPVDSQTTFWGRGDWIGKVKLPDGQVVNAIVDFKTSSKKYNESQIQFNDQLTAYFHAGKKYPFKIDKVIYVVFVKTKDPYIQWVIGDRTQDQVNEFLNKVNYYNEQIQNGIFMKKFGMSCQWCEYQALCLGDEERTQEELVVQVDDDIELVPGEEHDLGKCPEDVKPMDYVQSFIDEHNIEGHFFFKTIKFYEYMWAYRTYRYELKGNELVRLYKEEQEKEVA